jgi:RNA polymerase sigma-B factor
VSAQISSHVGFSPTWQRTAPAERAAREAASRDLLERRERSTDESERQRLLEQVVELNIEVAQSIAHRYRERGADLDDLEQVACLGLVNAARRYRPELGIPFLGFAIPTIRGEVRRYFRDSAWTIRIPRRLQELQWLIGAQAPGLKQELGREPTPTELAARLNLDLVEVTKALSARGCFNVLSLDQPVDVTGDLTLGDLLAHDEDNTLRMFEHVDQLQPVLDDLSARERRILQLRFVEGWTQSDIGADIGVTQMQVSRILRRILDSLRKRLQAA